MASSAELGFAINVDGVLTDKSKTLPLAKEVLSFLQRHDYQFVLFGDGNRAQTENELSLELKYATGVQVPVERIIFPYSAFLSLLKNIPNFATQNFLVIGSPISRIKSIAESYGFQRVFTTLDLQHDQQGLRIDAILVFNTPNNWDSDLKTILGLLTSRCGYVGTCSALNGLEELPNHGYIQDNQPSIHWADMRLSHNQGDLTFKQAVEEAWKDDTGGAELLGSWTELLLTFVEERLFKDVQTTRFRSAYLIGGTLAKSPLDKLGDFGSRFSVDWKSILVITALKRRMYKQPIVPVPNIGVGIAWAFDDAGFQEAAMKMMCIAELKAPPSKPSFNRDTRDTDPTDPRLLQADMPTAHPGTPPDATCLATIDLHKPLPHLPHRQIRAQIQKLYIGRLDNITDSPGSSTNSSESSSNQSPSSAATPFEPQSDHYQSPAISPRAPVRPSRPDDVQWPCGNVKYCQLMAAQAIEALASRHRVKYGPDGSAEDYDNDGRALDRYLVELVCGRVSPTVQDTAKFISTALEAHDRHLANMKSIQDSTIADPIARVVRGSTRRRLEAPPVRTNFF
jgi:hypothetical protein